MKSISTLLMALCCLVCAQFSSAQVFIPDQLERDWLNAEIPGIVDENGIMDTLHPMIAQVDSASFYFNEGGTDLIHFVGVSYLKSLQMLNVHVTFIPEVHIDTLPGSLLSLSLHCGSADVLLDGLPRVMERLSLYGSEGTLSIMQMPDTLHHFDLDRMTDITWSGSGYVETLSSSGPFYTTPSLVLPELHVGTIHLGDCYLQEIDLSRATAHTVSFSSGTIAPIPIVWPDSVETLSIDCTHIPFDHLPPTLRSLTASVLDHGCIPHLPEGLEEVFIHASPQGPACIPNWPNSLSSWTWMFDSPGTANYCSVLTSSCPGSNPGIAGIVFIDVDGDGMMDDDEPGLPQASVTLQPYDNVVVCQPNGSWDIGVLPEIYTITAGSNYPYIQSILPTEHTANVSLMGSVDADNHFAVTLLPNIQDLRVHVYADPARPGFNNQVHLRCENYGTMLVDAELTLAFDADQTWLGSSVAPTSTSSNTATWNFSAMPIGAVQHIVVDLTTAATVALGTDITHTLTADPIGTDETPLDNVYTFNDSVVGSYDPNDKLLSPAVLTPTDVAMGETPIEYTIRFQNTGTYLAERVVILDTLSQDLQWESMRFIASSHDQHWYIVDGVLHVIHNDIMLPDSNASEPESHGFFQFSMLPKTDLGNGSTIENIAHIVFDFNAPIITPPAVFMVDIGAGVEVGSTGSELRILPNPAHDRIQLIGDDATVLPYRIVDLLGQEVQRGGTQPKAWIDVQGLANGSHVLEVTKAGVPTSLWFVKR